MTHQRLITRRKTLQVIGGGLFLGGLGSGLGNLLPAVAEGHDYAAEAAAACMLTAEQEEGPFYVPVDVVRSDLIGGQNGLPFRMEITLINSITCKPLANAAVDIWHCNARGLYSDKSSEGTAGQTWLRGVQFTNSHGLASFRSIYPGHYSGRTTHIHIKVHTGTVKDSSGKLTGGHVSHTGNLSPTEAVNTAVYKLAAYNADHSTIVTQAHDFVYSRQHGSTARMTVTKLGNRLTAGVLGRITVGVNPDATPALIGIHS